MFTSMPLAGNGLAVVHDADGITEAQMHGFARETKLSETSFIQSATRDGADYRHRIWMVTGEIPFAGHPSLGAAVAVVRARGERSAAVVQETQAGLQPIDVELRDERRAEVSMLQESPVFGPELDPADILVLAGLGPGDADPAFGVQVVSTGVPQVLAALRPEALARARQPDYAAIEALLDAHGAITLYVAAIDPGAGTAHARAFFQGGEDPATGSAAGPLVAWAAQRAGAERLVITQGIEMGRPSELVASVEGDRVRVGGEVVVLMDGQLHLDT